MHPKKKEKKKIPQSSEKREFVQKHTVLGNVHYTSLLVDSQVHWLWIWMHAGAGW